MSEKIWILSDAEAGDTEIVWMDTDPSVTRDRLGSSEYTKDDYDPHKKVKRCFNAHRLQEDECKIIDRISPASDSKEILEIKYNEHEYSLMKDLNFSYAQKLRNPFDLI